ncbi:MULTISPECIES: TolC family protein [Thermomonas]|jgi:outer membrane protein TolC|uniref:TolC family protein n=1 Tax=Thermomonas TaxID=141948 RepID=UPI00200ADBBF|nr:MULTISPECIES: TolC family protein [Thermomonas]
MRYVLVFVDSEVLCLPVSLALPTRERYRVPVLCLLVAISAMPGLVLAAPAEISLAEAVQRAVERAPLLDARRAQVEAAQQETHRAGALPDPMLMVGIDNLPVTGMDAFNTRVDDMTMKKIGLRQEFPARAKRAAQRTVSQRRADEAVAQAQAEQVNLRQAAANAWIDLWAAQRELAALTSLHEQAQLAARLAKARVAGGTEPVADALAAQVAVIELDNRLEGLRAQSQAAQAELARWLGEDVERVPAEAPNFTSLPVPEPQLLAALDRLAPLLAASAQVETAAAEIDAARAERRSDWNVTASYGQRAPTPGGMPRSDMVMLEFGIGLPLFQRNRQDRGIAAREAHYQAALAMREGVRRQQMARIRAGIAQWQGFKRQVALHEDSLLPLARDRNAITLAAYRAGAPLRPWLDARRDELDVHLAHAEHLAELGRAWVALAYLLPNQEAQP